MVLGWVYVTRVILYIFTIRFLHQKVPHQRGHVSAACLGRRINPWTAWIVLAMFIFQKNPRSLAKTTRSTMTSSRCFVWRRPLLAAPAASASLSRRAGRQALALPFSLHPGAAHRDVDRGPCQWRRWGRRRWTTRGGSNNCSPRADRRSSLLPAPASSSPRWG